MKYYLTTNEFNELEIHYFRYIELIMLFTDLYGEYITENFSNKVILYHPAYTNIKTFKGDVTALKKP